MDRLLAASAEELTETDSVGPIIGRSVYEFLHTPRNLRIIAKLRAAGVNMEQHHVERGDLPLAGTLWVFTGRLERWTRGEAEARVKELGASIGDSVTKRTTHVVVGADPGSKAQRAQQLKLSVLDEDEFERIAGLPS
jgi:DNA ligase (NAD+)